MKKRIFHGNSFQYVGRLRDRRTYKGDRNDAALFPVLYQPQPCPYPDNVREEGTELLIQRRLSGFRALYINRTASAIAGAVLSVCGRLTASLSVDVEEGSTIIRLIELICICMNAIYIISAEVIGVDYNILFPAFRVCNADRLDFYSHIPVFAAAEYAKTVPVNVILGRLAVRGSEHICLPISSCQYSSMIRNQQ